MRAEMRYVTLLGITFLAAIAVLITDVGTARATALYSTGGKISATRTFLWVVEGSYLVTTTDHSTVLNTCADSQVHGHIETFGQIPIGLKITSIKWGFCTEPTETSVSGEFEIHHIAGTTNGTVTGKNTVFKINSTIFGA